MGQLALAWQMLTVELSKPEDFVSVLPQLQYVLDHASLDEHAEENECASDSQARRHSPFLKFHRYFPFQYFALSSLVVLWT